MRNSDRNIDLQPPKNNVVNNNAEEAVNNNHEDERKYANILFINLFFTNNKANKKQEQQQQQKEQIGHSHKLMPKYEYCWSTWSDNWHLLIHKYMYPNLWHQRYYTSRKKLTICFRKTPVNGYVFDLYAHLHIGQITASILRKYFPPAALNYTVTFDSRPPFTHASLTPKFI